MQENITTACILQIITISNRSRCVLKPKNLHNRTSSWWLGEKLFPGFSAGLDENIISVMACENSPCTKTSGTNLRLLELVQMPWAWKQHYWISFTCLMQWRGFTYTLYTLFQLFRFSEKNFGRENTLLTRTEKKIVTQALAYEHIFKLLFQCFLCCTASWLEWCGFSHF